MSTVLKENGYSLTASRKAIYEALDGNTPLTVRELMGLAGDRTDRSSVYRNIALFERLGIIQRIRIGWKYRLELSAAYSHHHHHLSCKECAAIIDFAESPAMESLIRTIAEKNNFTALDHVIEISGVCSACAAGNHQKDPS